MICLFCSNLVLVLYKPLRQFDVFVLQGGGSSKVIIEKETGAWRNIVKNYPSLGHKPFYNE